MTQPVTELDARFSDQDAVATDWDATHASALDDEPELRVEPPKLAAFLEETETPLDLLDDRVVRPRVHPGSAGRIRRGNHALKLLPTLLTHADG